MPPTTRHLGWPPTAGHRNESAKWLSRIKYAPPRRVRLEDIRHLRRNPLLVSLEFFEEFWWTLQSHSWRPLLVVDYGPQRGDTGSRFAGLRIMLRYTFARDNPELEIEEFECLAEWQHDQETVLCVLRTLTRAHAAGEWPDELPFPPAAGANLRRIEL